MHAPQEPDRAAVAQRSLSGPYSMSKHAIEAFTDALAVEMAPFDVHVSVVEPGNYKSRIFESLRRRLDENNRTFGGSRYAEQMQSS